MVDDKTERRAAALRANLRRRKAQARNTAATKTETGATASSPGQPENNDPAA